MGNIGEFFQKVEEPTNFFNNSNMQNDSSIIEVSNLETEDQTL